MPPNLHSFIIRPQLTALMSQKVSRAPVIFIIAALFSINGFAHAAGPSKLLTTLKEELTRNIVRLKQEKAAPYFLAYSVHDVTNTTLRASFGAVESDHQGTDRILTIEVRVGSPTLDNSHEMRGEFGEGIPLYSRTLLPIDDNPVAIKKIIWRETDKTYKNAVERLTKLQTNRAVKVTEEDTSADFSIEPPGQHYENPVTMGIDRALWKERLRNYTKPFLNDKKIYEASADLSMIVDNRYVVTSEGTELQTGDSYVRMLVYAMTKADDGMELPRYESYFASTPDSMPADQEVMTGVNGMMQDLAAMRTAPMVDPYNGPAILSGRASGVFFHEVFGHRIEGHRQKKEEEGQTFKKKIGQPVTATFLSVVFDPSLRRLGNITLAGFYKFDDEGVVGQRVSVVENGIFKNFLMNRSPIEGFDHSNGHGRCQAGFRPVARQSNLIVQSSQGKPWAALRQQLIDECKKQDKRFGLFFRDIEGGFTLTGRTIPNAFNVLPLVVYKIYADGRPDELVRGVDLIGTPLEAFSNIIASGDETQTFNGVCGAESGGVPVSASSPALLVSHIEVQKKEKSQERLPILQAPEMGEQRP